jgi:hypothetical protein
MPHLVITAQGHRIPAYAFCPNNYYSDMHNDLTNTGLLAKRRIVVD